MDLTITFLLIIFTSLISWQGFNRYDILDRLKHSPSREMNGKEFYRLLTSGFLHADGIHLLVNMFVLYSFGSYIESYVISLFGAVQGRVIFVLLYLLNIVFANIPTMMKHRDNPAFSSIGASGAVSGMVFIFILLQPWATLNLFFFIPVPAIIAGIIYLVYSSWEARKERGRIDHSAHFAGAIAGMLMIILLNRRIVNDFIERLVADFPLS